MTTPLLSIVIPTFNVEAKLEASLRSVLDAQAPFESSEVLVMDGGSTDATVDMAREWARQDERVRVWSELDKGIYDGMNKGIAQARGQLLYFLGAGDIVRPGTWMALSELPNLYTHLLLHGQVWHPGANVAPDAGANLRAIDLARYNIPHQGAFYGRDVFKTVGLYEPKYRIYADHVLNWRCWTDKRIETRFWSRIVADFELGGASSSLYDPEFDRDWSRLVWQRGGLVPWVAYQVSRRISQKQQERLRQLKALFRKRLK